MAEARPADRESLWCCLHCRGPLSVGERELACAACGRRYPIVAGIPLLVADPAAYFRAERGALIEAARNARQRAALIGQVDPYVGLPETTLARHLDVCNTEAAQAEMLLTLIDPANRMTEPQPDGKGGSLFVRPGWSFDILIPYLLRDWTGTAELEVASARIGGALKRAFPNPQGRSVAFAGCGAAGLPADLSADFARIVAYDLTLPILATARILLDGGDIDLALPRMHAESGRTTLRRRGKSRNNPPVELVAMDALHTAFADASLDCVVTAFLTDILPDPRALADEIHRILRHDGVWINYGPAGNNPNALWRFDEAEAPAFFQAAGFAVAEADAERGTVLDYSAACPSVSYRSAICYLTLLRKAPQSDRNSPAPMLRAESVRDVVPQHFPGAQLVHRLDAEPGFGFSFRHERVPGRVESWELGGRSVRMIMLVDGKRTVGQIAEILGRRQPPDPVEETIEGFARFFETGLIRWRE